MHFKHDSHFERRDIWREGKWLDLWSVVHFFSGISIGFCARLVPLEPFAIVVIVTLLLVGYEMWEALVHIQETFTNRVMDVVVGLVSFLPTYFWVNSRLSEDHYILVFGLVLTLNVILSVFGWTASRKAAVLEAKWHRRRELRRLRRARRIDLKRQEETSGL